MDKQLVDKIYNDLMFGNLNDALVNKKFSWGSVKSVESEMDLNEGVLKQSIKVFIESPPKEVIMTFITEPMSITEV